MTAGPVDAVSASRNPVRELDHERRGCHRDRELAHVERVTGYVAIAWKTGQWKRYIPYDRVPI